MDRMNSTKDRPTGRWIDTNEAYAEGRDGERLPHTGIEKCSVCGFKISPLFLRVRSYCPSCGAKMEGDME